MKTWIQTYTGLRFDFPHQPDPSVFRIEDQARALSMQCRYLGHVSRFYSVAEHAVRVSRRVEQLAIEAGGLPLSDEVLYLARWGLIHDNAEAYLGDIPRPWKGTPAFAAYKGYEKPLQAAIAVWLGLGAEEPKEIAAADYELLGTEARVLKSPVHPDWAATTPGGELPPMIPGISDLGWTWQTAEGMYLRRFRLLFGTGP